VPHSDIGRKFIIYYLVEGTGDTSFYHSNNYLAGKSYEEKNLTITETIQLEQGHWYLFNNQAIHGVKNISKPRYSLAFDISKIYNSYEQAYTDVEDSKILFL
jgi:hypothetical protein